jgi:hypothetical protein
MGKDLQNFANKLGVKLNEIRDLYAMHVEVTIVIRNPMKADHSWDTFASNDDPELVKGVIDYFSDPESTYNETTADK